MKEEEIGKVFSEKLANYSQTPPEGLWADIRNDAVLQKFNRTRLFRKIALRGILPVAIVSLLTVGLFVFLNNNEKTDNQLVNKIEKTESLPNSGIKQAEGTLENPATPIRVSTPVNSTPARQESAPQLTPVLPSPVENIAAADDNVAIEPLPLENSPVQPIIHTSTFIPATPTVSKVPSAPQFTPNTFNNDTPIQGEMVEKNLKSSELQYSRDTMVCRNSKVVLYVENAVNVRWSTGSYGNTLEIYPEDPILIYADVTKYDKTDTTIYIRIDVYDCDVFVPTAFTPNGDGLNDEFLVHAPTDINGYELVIFDKMSRVLFQTKSIYQGWDGTFDGKPLPQGAYFYVITYRDALNEKHVKKGQIVLVR